MRMLLAGHMAHALKEYILLPDHMSCCWWGKEKEATLDVCFGCITWKFDQCAVNLWSQWQIFVEQIDLCPKWSKWSSLDTKPWFLTKKWLFFAWSDHRWSWDDLWTKWWKFMAEVISLPVILQGLQWPHFCTLHANTYWVTDASNRLWCHRCSRLRKSRKTDRPWWSFSTGRSGRATFWHNTATSSVNFMVWSFRPQAPYDLGSGAVHCNDPVA